MNDVLKQLDEKIPRFAVSTRDAGNGRQLDYLAGWYVIDRLNRVVGPGNWAYSADANMVHSGAIKDRSGKDVHTVHYIAKVRLAVTLKEGLTTEFTDYGYGDGTDRGGVGKAHELAVKEAVTDGLKRCAKNLGLSFGLALYDKSGDGIDEEAVENPATLPAAPAATHAMSEAPPKTPRETINKLISQTSKVAIDKRRITQEQALAMLDVYGVATKEGLTDEQASELLNKLRELIK